MARAAAIRAGEIQAGENPSRENRTARGKGVFLYFGLNSLLAAVNLSVSFGQNATIAVLLNEPAFLEMMIPLFELLILSLSHLHSSFLGPE